MERIDKPILPVLFVQNSHEGPGTFLEVVMQNQLPWLSINASRKDHQGILQLIDISKLGAIVLLGGPPSANDGPQSDAPWMVDQVKMVQSAMCRRDPIPSFGTCLGMQVIGKAAGAEIVPATSKEVGMFDYSKEGAPYSVKITDAGLTDPLLKGVGDKIDHIFHLHGEMVQPKESSSLEVLGEGEGTPIQIIRFKKAVGFQGHLEVSPGLVAEWMYRHQDPDLRSLNNKRLIDLQQELQKQRHYLARTATLVFSNFLRQAGYNIPKSEAA